jgi:hypothetical protein
VMASRRALPKSAGETLQAQSPGRKRGNGGAQRGSCSGGL